MNLTELVRCVGEDGGGCWWVSRDTEGDSAQAAPLHSTEDSINLSDVLCSLWYTCLGLFVCFNIRSKEC